MTPETRRRLFRAAAVSLALAAAFGVVVFVLRPPCLILKYTGFYCGGCGSQRMFLALFRGDFPAAFAHNPFLFFAAPLAVLWLLWEAVRYVRGKPPLYEKKFALPALLCLAVLAIAFTVLRNLPSVTFLGP